VNFDLDDEQREIKGTAKEFLADRFKPEKVRELAESRSYDDALWQEVCELGWPGIAVPEEHGGQGLGMVELTLLCEEIGYACAPLPFISNAIAGLVIDEGGSQEQRERWLPGIASGEGRGAAALDREDPALVADADGAAVLLASNGVLVEPADAEVAPLELIDATRSFARVSASGGDPFEGETGMFRPMVALAGELTGVAQRTMEMAVDYARERQQFGRPIGSYQAVSHRCAQMLYDTEEARSLTYYAAWCAGAEPDSLPLAAHMAKARASDAAWTVTSSALQVFGGIGFTWEHDLQFWLKRARVDGQLLGSAGAHRERVAELAGLGAAEPAPA
jgi:alkylation response protein AidB-like acyl-CoA dehydrogenase